MELFDDVLDPHLQVRLAVATESAIVLSPSEVLDHVLRGRMADHFGDDLGAGDQRLTDLTVARAGSDEQYLAEFQRGSNLCVAVVQADGVTDGHAVLPGPILEDRIHGEKPVEIALCTRQLR